jgi:hypothetical protein
MSVPLQQSGEASVAAVEIGCDVLVIGSGPAGC